MSGTSPKTGEAISGSTYYYIAYENLSIEADGTCSLAEKTYSAPDAYSFLGIVDGDGFDFGGVLMRGFETLDGFYSAHIQDELGSYSCESSIGETKTVKAQDQKQNTVANETVPAPETEAVPETELALETEAVPESGSVAGKNNTHVLPYPEVTERYLTDDELNAFSDKESVRLAINEIYAMKGYVFDDPELQRYFDSQEWYVRGDASGSRDDRRSRAEAMMNHYEYENMNKLAARRKIVG